MFAKLRSQLFGSEFRVQLVRGGLGSIAVKTANAGLAFALAVALARTMGPEGYGTYSFALAVIMLCAVPAQLGVPQLVVRETAKTLDKKDFSVMRGLWRWSNIAVGTFSALALIIILSFILFTETGHHSTRVSTILFGTTLIPIIALASVRGAALRGLGRVVHGLLPESVIRPAILLILVLISAQCLSVNQITPKTAVLFYIAAATAALLIGTWLLRRSRPSDMGKRIATEYRASYWGAMIIPLAMISGMLIINKYADLLILGVFQTDKEVGIYRVTYQVALLVIFGLQAMNLVLQPHFARLHQQGDIPKLQKLVTSSARFMLLLAVPPVLLFALFGEDLLGMIFGAPYRSGGIALTILAIGQLLNAGLGSADMLLNMTGHERETMKITMISAALNVALNVVLIPIFDIVGAASSTAVTLFIWKMLLRRASNASLGLETAAFGRLGHLQDHPQARS